MKAAVILSLVAAVMAGVIEERACAGNNCNRAVTGTRDGLLPVSERQSACSSFLKATVTPDAVTTTVTVTVEPDAPSRFKRDAALEYRAATELPTAVPAYASAACNGAAYSSACLCWGITAATTTAPTPTETKTVTVTADYCEDL